MGISRFDVNWRKQYRNIVLEIATACGLAMTWGQRGGMIVTAAVVVTSRASQ